MDDPDRFRNAQEAGKNLTDDVTKAPTLGELHDRGKEMLLPPDEQEARDRKDDGFRDNPPVEDWLSPEPAQALEAPSIDMDTWIQRPPS